MAKIIAEINDGKLIIIGNGSAPALMNLVREVEDKILGEIAESLHITKEQMEYVFNAGKHTESMDGSKLDAYCDEILADMLKMKEGVK